MNPPMKAPAIPIQPRARLDLKGPSITAFVCHAPIPAQLGVSSL